MNPDWRCKGLIQLWPEDLVGCITMHLNWNLFYHKTIVFNWTFHPSSLKRVLNQESQLGSVLTVFTKTDWRLCSIQEPSSFRTSSSCLRVESLSSSWRRLWASTPAREASPAGGRSAHCLKVNPWGTYKWILWDNHTIHLISCKLEDFFFKFTNCIHSS